MEETEIDTLAAAIGNAHDFFRERDIPDWERLEKIRDKVQVPLILHGGSDWNDGKAIEAVEKGIGCFNVDTNIRLAFVNTLSSIFRGKEDPGVDVRRILSEVKNEIKESVKEKITLYGSAGKDLQ